MENVSDTSNAALNRNTINQRASRARKRDYITSLERKLRDYETHGVQATEKVQSAARHVAEENRVLRDEVRLLREQVRCLEEVLGKRDASGNGNSNGHSTDREAELDAAWRRIQDESRQQQQQWQGQSLSAAASVVSLHVEQSPEAQYPSPPEDIDIVMGTTHYSRAKLNPRAIIGHIGSSRQDLRHDGRSGTAPTLLTNFDNGLLVSKSTQDKTQPPISSVFENTTSTTPESAFPPEWTAINTANTTPCEEAALIIASMRGLSSSSNFRAEILPELGCETAEKAKVCAVDNVRLFGIMDQDAGRR